MNLGKYILLTCKGIAMGAADVVPGVSGGTIAFISGIYDELIHSLKSFNTGSLKLLFSLKFRSLWKEVNGTFLLAVFSGILVSIFSLARLLKYLMETYPIFIWSFFFGLVLASAIVILIKINKWSPGNILALIIGTVVMFVISTFSPAETTEAYWFIFISGAIAVCAMILPGISGAFILLILGKYQFILGAVSAFDLPVLVIFGSGVITGLISFANLLSWLLGRYRDTTISALAGFLIGSLNKIWPWKENISERISSDGHIVPLLQKNILPGEYLSVTGESSYILHASALILIGIFLVLVLDRLAKKPS
ncbi:MAG TPA: DUF368 domain-containing protein [Bacteroidales bacterium]|nr:DUF368 domain-containing protein [Bacteroidales bacterium]